MSMNPYIRNALALAALAIPVAALAGDETHLGPTVLVMEIEKPIPPGNVSLKNAATSKIASKRDMVALGSNPKFTVAAKAFCKPGSKLTAMQVFLSKVVINNNQVYDFSSWGSSPKLTGMAGQVGARIDIPVELKVAKRAGPGLDALTFNPAAAYEKMLAAYVAKGHTAAQYLRETQAFDMTVPVSLVAWCRMDANANSLMAGKTYPGVVTREVTVTVLYNGDPAIVDGPAARASTTTRKAEGGPPAHN